MTTTALPAPAWPEPTSTATLRWALAAHQTRVLRAAEDSVTVALLGRTGAGPTPRTGAPMVLRWADERGLHQRPVSLARMRGGLVHLSAQGDAASTQRRRFYRAPVAIDLTISDGAREVVGTSVDLSEGGMRAAVEGDPLVPSSRVTATVRIGGAAHSLPSTVVRHVTRGRHTELGLAFEPLPEAAADLIRREVFTVQLQGRRNGGRL